MAQSSSGFGNKKGRQSVKLSHRDFTFPSTVALSKEATQKIRSKFPNDYFGLPPYSVQQSSLALAYKSRAPLEDLLLDDEHSLQGASHGERSYEKSDSATRKSHASSSDMRGGENNYTAQRKVISALLTMVSNDHMVTHFLHKGGLAAVMRIIGESKDKSTLMTCSECLIQASADKANCKLLLQQNVTASLQQLVEFNNERLMQNVAVVLGNLSSAPDLEELMMLNGVLGLVQTINLHTHRIDSMCFLLLCLSNIAPAITLPENAEQVMRLCFQNTQKIDVLRSKTKALFIADLYNNFSRLTHFSSLLVEEGVLPLLLHLIDSHPVDEVLKLCTEALANLSLNRKNRREISTSGIASRLPLLFDRGSSVTRSSALLIIGNLLSSGLFHDKVANHTTISNLLTTQLDLQHPKQFNAVSYCLCQLSKVEHSCAVLVECEAIPLVLSNLRKAPAEALDYLWAVLTSITSYAAFFEAAKAHSRLLLTELYEEVRFDSSTVHQQMSVVQIGLNMCKRPQFSAQLPKDLVEKFVQSLKIVFSSRLGTAAIQMAALTALIKFNQHCRAARPLTLGIDLIDLFQEVGIEDDKMNVKYVGLLNIISNEEACCYKLLESGVQKMLVSLQDSFTRLVSGAGKKAKKKRVFKKGQSIKDLGNIMQSLQQHAAAANAAAAAAAGGESAKIQPRGGGGGSGADVAAAAAADGSGGSYEYDAAVEGELGKELTAATLHNLTLKRPVGAPGVLVTLLSLARNCKTLRVLHCIRSLANMSAHPKAKVLLSKEARRILPMLTVTMRCGCEEAEKVQRYCAITLCNMLASPLDKSLLEELVNSGAIVDLVVVTLLRINSTHTKETLGKAFFNLLNRAEIRETLVIKLDMLSAVLELAKHEYLDLLELCMKAIYNITCEIRPGSGFEEAFASKLQQLKVPQMAVARLVSAAGGGPGAIEGSVGTRSIRQLLGKIIANMSFNKQLVVDLTNSSSVSSQGAFKAGSVADALYRVYVLQSDESTFCASSTLFNISRIPECRVLVDSRALALIVDILSSGDNSNNGSNGNSSVGGCSVDCTMLCAAALCNFSMLSVFHDKLSAPSVVQRLVQLIASPSIHMSVKMDAIQTVYNLVTSHPPSRAVFVANDGVIALWKLLKVQGSGGGTGRGGPTDEYGNPIGSSGSSGSSVGDDSSSGSSSASGGVNVEDEEAALLILGHIIKELCDVLPDVKYEKKLMTDGIMSIILRLSKIELPVLKLDMSFAMYSLCKMHDTLRFLKADAIDALFWLTLHDTLQLQTTIDRNVARALRCFSATAEEAKVVARQERFLPVFKALIKSKNEDVLWQTAGVMYNLMHSEYCLKILLERGLVGFIFDIAASGFDSVRHVCSACLHMIPENMPNMEDPVVLELVLCLLEAQGDKFSELSEKPNDKLPYSTGSSSGGPGGSNSSTLVTSCHAGSSLQYPGTDFKASWLPMSCDVEAIFTPALISSPAEANLEISMAPLDANAFAHLQNHAKIFGSQYNDFKRELSASTMNSKPSETATATATSAVGAEASDSLTLDDLNSGGGSAVLSTEAQQRPHRNTSYPTTMLEASASMVGFDESAPDSSSQQIGGFAMDSNYYVNISTPDLQPKLPPGAVTTAHFADSSGDMREYLLQQQQQLDARIGSSGSRVSSTQTKQQQVRRNGSRASHAHQQHHQHQLPLIAPSPSVPDDTVRLLNSSINRDDAKRRQQLQQQQQRRPGSSSGGNVTTSSSSSGGVGDRVLLSRGKERLTMSASLDVSALRGDDDFDDRTQQSAADRPHSREQQRQQKSKKSTGRVIQITNNSHGNTTIF